MEDKYEEIIAQYQVQIKSKRRVRGALLLETEGGLRLLRLYNGHRSHLLTEEQIKQHLVDQGYPYVDQAVKNERDEFLTRDASGNLWIMRKWYAGRECDIREPGEVVSAAMHLAKLHRMLVEPLAQQKDSYALEAAESSQALLHSTSRVERPYFEKRNRELKRIHSYIRKKRRKNEMELGLLNAFGYYYEQGCQAEEMDAKEQIYQELYQRAARQELYVHGSYNYHNLLLQGKRIATTNFENSRVGIQIIDLYGFLRKVMEKNGWKSDMGIGILNAYQERRSLSEQERKLLYTLLLYPEKYWKQCNFYYNGKKSWTSGKNYDKLLRLQAQEQDRRQFLETIKGVLF